MGARIGGSATRAISPTRRDTIFDLASLTKPIATTSAIMMLLEEGSIALDDPVAKVLPTFADRGKEEVTIRHLLTHSAGLKPVREFHELPIQKERKTGERLIGTPDGKAWIVDRVLRSAPVHEPGAAAVYGDLNFITLSALRRGGRRSSPSSTSSASRGSSRAWVSSTRASSRFRSTARRPHPKPSAPRRRDRERAWRERIVWGEVHDPNCFAMVASPVTRVFSTADDVMRFGQLFLDAYHGRNESLPPERPRVLREAVARVVGLGDRLGHADQGRLDLG